MSAGLWGPLVRRWYVVLLGLMLTGALMVSISGAGTQQYETKATVVLLPGQATTGQDGNPFLFLSGLVQARDALIRVMRADSVRQEIVGDVVGADYVVQIDPETSGPVIVMSTTSTDPATTLVLRDKALDALRKNLRALQLEAGGTRKNALIRPFTLSSDSTAESSGNQQLRPMIAVGVIGTILTFLAAALLDTFLLGRRSRRERLAHDGTSGQAESTDPGADSAGADAPPGTTTSDDAGVTPPVIIKG